MFRFLPFVALALAAFADQRPLSNLQILQWQAEAQARERALSRRSETQLEKTSNPQPNRPRHPRRAPKSRP